METLKYYFVPQLNKQAVYNAPRTHNTQMCNVCQIWLFDWITDTVSVIQTDSYLFPVLF